MTSSLGASSLQPSDRREPMVGLLTDDEALVQRVGLALPRATTVVVASDAPSALDMIGADAYDARVIDVLSLRRLLPDLTRLQALSGAEGLELWVGAPGRCFSAGRPFPTHVFPPGALDALASHLRSLFVAREADHHAELLILGESRAIRAVREQVHNVARFGDVSVLILGETGTGKELVAEAIHRASSGPSRPFIAINCAAVPASLFESELFGHEAGAYTGARGVRVGLLEAAAGGTLFLDEVGEMPPLLQPKLLRVLETRRFRRVGSNRDVPLLARVVSATNRMPQSRDDGSLRSDLYYRLAGYGITLPPLRDRLDDVEILARAFLRSFAERYRIPTPSLSWSAVNRLRAHRWPGNVRELRALIEQAAILAAGDIDEPTIAALLDGKPAHGTTPPPARVAAVASLSPKPPVASPEPPRAESRPAAQPANLRELERNLIVEAFQSAGGNLSRAAQQLGLPRTTLRAKLRRYGVL